MSNRMHAVAGEVNQTFVMCRVALRTALQSPECSVLQCTGLVSALALLALDVSAR